MRMEIVQTEEIAQDRGHREGSSIESCPTPEGCSEKRRPQI